MEMTLFDALAQRDEAMARVEEAAPLEWKDAAWSWLLDYLRTHREFFPDDVWAGGLEPPPERRAFGPLVLRAARAGYIVKAGRLRPRVRGHGTPAEVWTSQLYDPDWVDVAPEERFL